MKKILFTSFMLVHFTIGLMAQSKSQRISLSSNNDCSSARLIEQTDTSFFYSDSIKNATLLPNSVYADFWYEFEAKSSDVKISINIWTNDIYLYRLCGGESVKINRVIPNGVYFKGLVIGEKYKIQIRSYQDFKFSLQSYLNQVNENCSGALNILTSDTLKPYFADLDFAQKSNTPLINIINNENEPIDLWYKFTATSENMSIWVSYLKDFQTQAVVIELFDYCSGKSLAFAGNTLGGFNELEHVVLSKNNFIVGNVYYYRLVKTSKTIRVRLEEKIYKQGLYSHGVIKNKLGSKFNLFCVNDAYVNNTKVIKSGRTNFSDKSCSTGYEEAKTREFFLKICPNTQSINDFSLICKSKTLKMNLELMDSTANNTFKQLFCKEAYSYKVNDSTYNYNIETGLYFDFSNKFVRVEISDIVNISDLDFSFRAVPYVGGGVGENELNTKVKLYPNPTSNTVNLELIDIPEAKLQLFNQIGELLIENKIQESLSTFDLRLQSGMYFAKITTKDSFKVIRLVIE